MPLIAVTRERRAGETRVAAVPETVKKLIAQGFAVRVEKVIPPAMASLAEVRPQVTQVWISRELAKRLEAHAGKGEILPGEQPPIVQGPAPEPPPTPAGAVRLSRPSVKRDAPRARVVVRWSVLDAGPGVRGFRVESRPVGGGRWVVRARGGAPAALSLPTGVPSVLRLIVEDAAGRSSTTPLGTVLVPRDDRTVRAGRDWTRASDAGAWARTVTRGSAGATLDVRFGAGRPVLFVRGGGRIELSGDGRSETFRVTPGGIRTITGARRGTGELTVRVVRGTVGLDGVALVP